MLITEYTGVLAEIVAAINDAGSPPTIRQIEVNEQEMQEIVSSKAFTTGVANYYGGSSAPTFENVVTAIDGKILSLYLNGVLICVGPYVPYGPLADLAYGPLAVTQNDSTEFSRLGADGKQNLFLPSLTSADDFTIGSNADIELGLSVRRVGDSASYNDGSGAYEIELGDDENWYICVTAASRNPDITNIAEMYDVSLHLDVDAENEQMCVWNLMFGNMPEGRTFAWMNGGSRLRTLIGSPADKRAAQCLVKYTDESVRPYLLSGTSKNNVGAPYGVYSIVLKAKPKFGEHETVENEVMAFITKKP